MTASKAKSKSASSRQRREMLTAEEQAELEAALEDGFWLPAFGAPLKEISIGEAVDEPFADARIITGRTHSGKERQTTSAALAHLHSPEAQDAVINRLLYGASQKKRDWRSKSHLNFDLQRLRGYFKQRVNDYQKEEQQPVCENVIAADFAELAPYSKVWFEHLVLLEIQYLETMLDSVLRSEPTASRGSLFDASVFLLLEGSAKVGRLVQDYRWRFTHGMDALLGKTIGRAARQGGSNRKGKFGPHTEKVLQFMGEQIAAGRSVRNAAERAADKGIGTSRDANMKLWNRRRKPDPEA